MTLSLALALTMVAPAEAPIVAVSIFKNGYAFAVREAAIPAGGEVDLSVPSSAVLGTYWIGGSPGVSIQSIRTTTVETEVERNAQSVDELLAMNVGRKVRLEVSQEHASQSWAVEGKLLSADGQIAIVEGNGMRTTVPKSGINRLVSFEGDYLVYASKVKRSTVVVRVRATGPKDGKLTLTALQPGLSWVPVYRADISDPKKLRLLARASLINDLADLTKIPARLVVGFPNVRYLGQVDPLVSGATLDQTLRGLNAPGGGGGLGGGIMNQARGQVAADADFFQGISEQAQGGEQLEDLFFYNLPNLALKKGDRSYNLLFESEAEYRHIYTLDVDDQSAVYAQQREAPIRQAALDVWHTVRFPNSSGVPLTTGVATVFKDGEILGQDQMSYTSRGAEAALRITKALDVNATALEEEVSRERGFIKRDNVSLLDRVTVKGVIEIVNRKDKAVEMRVVKTLTGETVEVGQGGEAKKTPAGLGQRNPVTQIVWKPQVGKGQTTRLTYTYQLLTPSY